MTYTIGSFCTGYGGADLAVEAVLGPAEHLWHTEFNDDKVKILAAHWPTVPNLGDITKVDWSQVARPDVVTAGFPCTDISSAGRQAGMASGRLLAAGQMECGCRWADHQAETCRDSTAPTTRGASVCAFDPWETLNDGDFDEAVKDAIAWLNARDLASPDGPPPKRTVGGTRSGVWSNIAAAIAILRPRLVLIENVRALLSTKANRDAADSHVEPGPADVGNGPAGPVLRAIGAVLGDLSDLGFDAEWCTVAASDVGACHRRERVFVLAWPRDAADTESVRYWHERAQGVAGVATTAVGGRAGADGLNLLPTPTSSDTTGAGHSGRKGGHNLRTEVSLLPTPTATSYGSNQSASAGAAVRPSLDSLASSGALLPTPAPRLGDERGSPSARLAGDRMPSGRRNLDDAVALLPTPTARDGDGRGEGSPGYWARRGDERANGLPLGAVVNLLPTPRATDGTKGGPNQRGSSGDLMLPSAVMELLPTPVTTDANGARNATAVRHRVSPTAQTNGWALSDVAHADRWGRYGDAILRWEQIVGRPAPDPTEPGSKGQPRLSPRFVEFMMGLPDGWVTDHVGRNAALHALGDGVVWQQGAYALRRLLRAAVTPVGVAS
jgi:DNA (cytosine-5)-methyltransferase 1